MNNVKVSVIIPVYNSEKYLEECLDSILNQTLRELEIVCVDDCSTDNSFNIIKNYSNKDSRVKCIKMDINSGSGIARNKGWGHAKGEYISFVDSDDYLLDKKAYEKFYSFAKKNNANFVSANLKAFKGKNFYESRYCKKILNYSSIKPQDYGIPWFFQKNLFKKSFLDKNKIQFPNYVRGQDPVFLSRALTKVDTVHCLPIDFYAYRSSPNKINSEKKEIDYLKHFRDVFKTLKLSGFEEMCLEYEKIMYQVFINHKSYFSQKTLEKNMQAVFKNDPNILSTYKLKQSTKLSVIVPVYNVENCLRQCLDSVVNQTLNEIEIICVNDGSTDSSPEILSEYAQKDERIKIINKKNAGLGAARNTGMKYATGEYIGFVDSDDWVDHTMFEKLYNNAKYHNSDLVMCPICIVDDNHKEDHDFSYFNLDCFSEDFDNSSFDYQKTKDFFFRICVTANNKIYRNDFLEMNKIKFPEGLIFEDNPFFYKTFLKAKRVSLIRDFLYFYRVKRDDSIISSADKTFFDVLKIHDLTKKIFLEDLELNEFKVDLISYIILSIFNRYSQISDIHKEEFFELIKEDFEGMDLKNLEINALNYDARSKYHNVLVSNSLEEFELLEEKSKLEKQNLELLKDNELLKSHNKKLQKEWELKQKELVKKLAFRGYLKYKSKNIVDRIIKRIRSC